MSRSVGVGLSEPDPGRTVTVEPDMQQVAPRLPQPYDREPLVAESLHDMYELRRHVIGRILPVNGKRGPRDLFCAGFGIQLKRLRGAHERLLRTQCIQTHRRALRSGVREFLARQL